MLIMALKKLDKSQLLELSEILRQYYPATLNIYHLARNQLTQDRWWPNVQFYVDSFPDVGVCIATTPKTTPDFPPFINGYTVFVFSNSPERLRKVLDSTNVIDWSTSVNFFGIQNPDISEVIKDKCIANGGKAINANENDLLIEHAYFVGFNLNTLDFSYVLPEGFRLGTLSTEHASQLTEEKHYGNLANNYTFFHYFFERKFPNSAIFNPEGVPVSYILYRPEGCLGAAYTNPPYRGRGFYKVVAYDLLTKLKDLGETEGYADITYGNEPSVKALMAIGAFVYGGNNDFQWFECIPKNGSSERLHRSPSSFI